MNFGLVAPLRDRLHLRSPFAEWRWAAMSMFGHGNSKPQAKPEVECGDDDDPANDACKGSLRSVIESQIIPRLLQAHSLGNASNAQAFNTDYAPNEDQVQSFATRCVQESAESASAHVRQLQREGVSNSDIFLKLIASAARCLGTWWEEDRIDFTAVTLGLLHMQQITHELGYDYHAAPKSAQAVRRVMLASAPGSQHILGLVMVSQFFRKEGWQVVVEIANTEAEIYQAAANEWFDLVGLSVGLVEQIPTLPELIRQVKKASRNPDTPVLLGGPAFFKETVQAHSLGADGISLDALHGLELASKLVDPR